MLRSLVGSEMCIRDRNCKFILMFAFLITQSESCKSDLSLPLRNEDSALYFSSSYYHEQFIRIELDQPIKLKAITLNLDGVGDGDFNL